ncbi:histidine kinase [Dyella flava]|nr:histidine kinase [Dyella flava]
MVSIAALIGWGAAGAAAVPASIKDYVHTSWTQREGAPADIRALAQTPDGWYWLGTSMGLYRFDGVKFEKRSLFPVESDKSQSVASLLVTRRGDLWVTLSYGGALELTGEDHSQVVTPPGLPSNAATDALAEDAEHDLWALVAGQLYRLHGHQWQLVAKSGAGLPEAPLDDLLVDAAGTVWAFTDTDVFRLRRGQVRFEKSMAAFPKGPQRAMWQTNDGGIWVADDEGERWLNLPDGPDPGTATAVSFQFSSSIRVIDRDGTMWFIDCDAAILCRYPHAKDERGLIDPKVSDADKLTLDDNIMSGLSMTVMVDRNGDIWVGTKAGLDRFRKPLVTVVHFPQPLVYFSVVPNPNGSVWVGTASMGYTDRWWLVDGYNAPHAWGDFIADTTASFRDKDGSILLGGESGLRRFDGKAMASIAVPDAMQDRKIQSILRDGKGRLWIAFRNAPVDQLDGNTWISKGHISALPDWHPISTAVGKDGSAWFGYDDSKVFVLRGNELTRYTRREGVQTGSVTAIWPGSPTLVGGELGLAALAGDRFRMLQTNVPGTLAGITGIVLASDDCYWFNTQAGAVRIRAEDLRRAMQDVNFKMPFQLVDALSGMPGGAQRIRPLPSLTQGVDGRLWFAQMSGLAWMDPRQVPMSLAPLRVVMLDLVSKAGAIPVDGRVGLPEGTHSFRIAYTALAAYLPERVTFRYRLVGAGSDWQFVGTDRVANFAGLGPGHYRFELEASEDGSPWTSPSVLPITIAPAFYQTIWFGIVCALVLLIGVVLITRRHTRLSNQRLLARVQIRHAERERIARDLHDTLLQGVQGLILRVHAAASQLSPEHPVSTSIERALERGEDILVEGRNRLHDLRLGMTGINELVTRITGFAEQCSADYPARVNVIANDSEQAIDPVVGEEAFLIAREALLNAFKHAHASDISVEVGHGGKGISMVIRDNGSGFNADVKPSSPQSRCWGLVGMRERASSIGAEFAIKSKVGQGTEVSLWIPANAVYAGGR